MYRAFYTAHHLRIWDPDRDASGGHVHKTGPATSDKTRTCNQYFQLSQSCALCAP